MQATDGTGSTLTGGQPVCRRRGGRPAAHPGRRAWFAHHPCPAWISDRSPDVAAWNEPDSRLLGDPGDLPRERRNALVVMLTTDTFRRVADWERIAADRVAVF